MKTFQEFLNEGLERYNSKLTKAFNKVLDKYNWGNFRFDMGDFEVSTTGGEEDEYNEKEGSSTMVVYANSEPVFTFKYIGDDFKMLKVNNVSKTNTILDNLISDNWTVPKN